MLAAPVTFGLFTGLAVGPDAEQEDVALRVSLDLILRDIKTRVCSGRAARLLINCSCCMFVSCARVKSDDVLMW